MGRSRSAAIEGARRVLAEHGVRKTTMGEVAIRGGLAKATLYNHVRTKDQLLTLVVTDGVARVATAAAAALAGAGLAAGLTAAADALAADEVLAGVRRTEPAALVPLAAPGSGAAWDEVRRLVGDALRSAGARPGRGEIDLVLRWLTSLVLAPGTAPERAAAAGALVVTLPAAASRTSFAAVPTVD
jgi:AcrR family transcriptional regulator